MPFLSQTTDLRQTTSTQQLQQMRQIQAMTVLQLQRQDLETFLEQKYEENPCLEIKENTAEPVESSEKREDRRDEDSDRFRRLDEMRDDISYYDEQYGRPSRSAQEEMSDRHQEFIENIPTNPQSLPEFLHDQLSILPLTETQVQDVDRVIYALDEQGFLVTPIEDLFGLEPDGLERGRAALKIVQSLEPKGVGAQNLKECLLLQIDAKLRSAEADSPDERENEGEKETPDYAAMRVLLTRYAQDLEANRLPKIARETGWSMEKIYEVLRQIGRLNSNPGRDFSPRGTVVTPDLYCAKNEKGEWYVTLDEHGLPEFTITTRWGKQCTTDEEREFIHKKLNAARWLLEALEQRRETLLAVGNALVQVQSEFLEKGPRYLKPLTEKQLAEMIGRHPSTVSRAVREKWIQTPRGLFPLSDFFSASVAPSQSQAQAATDGTEEESASRDAVQHELLALIDAEDKQNPLSDDQLAGMLNVARTTINKYRKELNIPSSRKRKIYT